ncbi:hypothetical protein BDZ90DRAFT_53743 [Jaminaea rosea]|uniref:Uncharacterized protein n=1 Tax=Jaminaea rosea TaxID=1569628 RepID=A0A316UM64_9BASI|nr:hypothetical protein BDZ90DRAFT_53743 [Jaminaea rosea]PWN25908.1 hypothetical protein BDZ90DRAFT_53743 [Jaminaea rosea]
MSSSTPRLDLNRPRPIFLGWTALIFVAGFGYYYAKQSNLAHYPRGASRSNTWRAALRLWTRRHAGSQSRAMGERMSLRKGGSTYNRGIDRLARHFATTSLSL